MKCIPKRGRQPGLGDKGRVRRGLVGPAGRGGAIRRWIDPNNAVLVPDGKNQQSVPTHINALQQVLLSVCPRIVPLRLGRGGGRKETSRGMRSAGVETGRRGAAAGSQRGAAAGMPSSAPALLDGGAGGGLGVERSPRGLLGVKHL